MNGTADLDYECDSENEALHQKLEEAKRTNRAEIEALHRKLEEERRSNRAEIEDLERALATELNDIEELEKYKQLVREKWVEFSNEIDELSGTDKGIDLTQFNIQSPQSQSTSEFNAEMATHERTLVNSFTPLSAEADLEVNEALIGEKRFEILVTHEPSNIQITRAVMQCLSPGRWLNDEVLNLYMELLKEREIREPDCYLKCHFFNTFFYKKILVPIHQDTAKHWCLAVISIRDRRLEYLDSLKGGDPSILDVLGRYIADEAKDKDGKFLDVRNWDQCFRKDIPEQMNGWDCGIFMLKYADFISRGAPLNFAQGDMEDFRRKMVWEILHLRAT